MWVGIVGRCIALRVFWGVAAHLRLRMFHSGSDSGRITRDQECWVPQECWALGVLGTRSVRRRGSAGHWECWALGVLGTGSARHCECWHREWECRRWECLNSNSGLILGRSRQIMIMGVWELSLPEIGA